MPRNKVYVKNGVHFKSYYEVERFCDILDMQKEGLVQQIMVNILIDVFPKRGELKTYVFRIPISYYDVKLKKRRYEITYYNDWYYKNWIYAMRHMLLERHGIMLEFFPVKPRQKVTKRRTGDYEEYTVTK